VPGLVHGDTVAYDVESAEVDPVATVTPPGFVRSVLSQDAIDHLSDALPRLPTSFVRARTGMLVDLAHAHATAGDRDAALDYTRQAKRLAAQINSDASYADSQPSSCPSASAPRDAT
jgi:hypothetical protein